MSSTVRRFFLMRETMASHPVGTNAQQCLNPPTRWPRRLSSRNSSLEVHCHHPEKNNNEQPKTHVCLYFCSHGESHPARQDLRIVTDTGEMANMSSVLIRSITFSPLGSVNFTQPSSSPWKPVSRRRKRPGIDQNNSPAPRNSQRGSFE